MGRKTEVKSALKRKGGSFLYHRSVDPVTKSYIPSNLKRTFDISGPVTITVTAQMKNYTGADLQNVNSEH